MVETVEKAGTEVNRGPAVALVAFLILCVIGVISAYHLTGVFVGTHMAPDEYESFCNLSEKVNCERVSASDQYSIVANVPVSVWATAGYLFVAFLAFVGLMRLRERFAQGFLFLFGVLFLGVSVWLIIVMHFFIQSWCIVCLAIDAINIALFGISIALIKMSRQGIVEAIKRDFAATFGSVKVLALLAAVGFGILGGAYVYGTGILTDIENQNQKLADKTAEKERKEHSIWSDVVENGGSSEMVYIPTDEEGTRKEKSSTEESWSKKVNDTPIKQSCEDKKDEEKIGKIPREAVNMGVSKEGYPWIGALEPILEISEFTDFQCPYCQRAHMIVRKLVNKYPSKLRLYHRQFPLDSHCNPMINGDFHLRACELARISECAGEQGRFWEMNDFLFHHQGDLKVGGLTAAQVAERLALDMGKFECCMTADSSLKPIKAGIAEAIEKGLKGTPAYVIDGAVYYGKIPDEALQKLENGK